MILATCLLAAPALARAFALPAAGVQEPAAESAPAATSPPGELVWQDQLVAVVNDQILLWSDINLALRQQLGPGPQPSPEDFDRAYGLLLMDLLFREGWRLAGRDEAMLDRFVQKTLEDEIDRAGSLAALTAEKAAQGITLEDFKRIIRRWAVGGLYREIELGRQPEKGKAFKVTMNVAPWELQEHYAKNQDLFSKPRRVQGRVIMIPKGEDAAAARELATSILAQLEAGEIGFEEAVTAYSDFRKSNLGDTGWVTASQSWAAPLKSFLLESAPGTLSPVLELAGDWAIALVETVEEGGIQPFAEVQGAIRQQLLDRKYQELVSQALVRIRNRCYVWPEKEVDEALRRLSEPPPGDPDADL